MATLKPEYTLTLRTDVATAKRWGVILRELAENNEDLDWTEADQAVLETLSEGHHA